MLPIIISITIFVSYLAYVLVRYGMQKSISDSYYRLTTMNKWLFTIATWGYTFPLFFTLGTTGGVDGLFFLAASLICLVGAAPDFKMPSQRKAHQIGAEGGMAVSMLWIATTGLWYITIASCMGIAAMLIFRLRNHTWWIEVLAYFTIIIAITLNKINHG